tara:strand:- start:549 stop:878 length:330 start_codon:yes stop_codon:yes gene_type:complete
MLKLFLKKDKRMKVNDDSSNITRINLIYEGEVQGVGFRYFVKKKADSLGISGYVKNQNDGSVFVNAQGNISAIERLTKLCQIATPNSKVKSVVKIQKPIENIRGFRIIF